MRVAKVTMMMMCSGLSKVTVNVLKIRTLYSILFLPKFCFLCSCFLKYLVERQTVQTQIRLLLKEQSDLGLHCLHMSFCQIVWCSKF